MSEVAVKVAAVAAAALVGLSAAGCSAARDSVPTVSPSESAGTPTVSAQRVEPAPQPGGTTPSSAPTSTAAASVAPQTAGEDPHTEDVSDAAVVATVTSYVQARESKSSWNRKSPLDWLEEVRPLLTAANYERMRSEVNPDGTLGSEWEEAHERELGIRANVAECGVPVAAGANDDQMKVIQCAVTNTVVDRSGAAVPITQIPQQWTNVGPQAAAMVVLVKEQGRWLIEQDATGLAS